MWLKPENVDTDVLIFGKCDYEKKDFIKKQNISNTPIDESFIRKRQVTEYETFESKIYPIKIVQTQNNILEISRSDGNVIAIGTIDISSHIGGWVHLTIVKDEKFIYSTIESNVIGSINTSSLAFDYTKKCNNKCPILIGGVPTRNGYKGLIDEVRLYSINLEGNALVSLHAFPFQTHQVGNVFYRGGNIVISTPNKILYDALKTTEFTLEYKSTHRIYEYSTLCRVPKRYYNYTQNPSARKDSESDLVLDDMVEGTMKPYVTTIGLYNNGNLMAVGKLSQPIELRNDVDMNFYVKWDG
jgi:hypothetical protein